MILYDLSRKSSRFFEISSFFKSIIRIMTGKEFSERVDYALAKRNLTRKAIKTDLGISSSTFSSWAAGRGSVPNANVVATLAVYLNVSTDWLIFGKERDNDIPAEVLALAEDINRLPAEYREILLHNVESYKALCLRQEKESSQDIG